MRTQFGFNLSLLIICLLAIVFFSLALVFGATSTNGPQFKFLAESFLNGKLYFDTCPINDCKDTILLNGHYYWPLGPLPAIILMPFVFIFSRLGIVFSQFHLNYMVLIALFALIIKISRKLGYSKGDSLYWAFAMCFAGPLLYPAFQSSSWMLSHTITVFLLFCLIYEYTNKKRSWVLSLLSGLILATRITAGLGSFVLVIFSIIQDSQNETDLKNKFRCVYALAPFIVSALLLAVYNYVRFGTFLETGYALQITSDYLIKARSYGLFSLVHVPTNLYFNYLAVPVPVFKDTVSYVLAFPFIRGDVRGMSIFLSSPYLLYLFFLSYRDRLSKIFLLSAAVPALILLTSYATGYIQLGYRYSLDFLPFIFYLLMRNSIQKREIMPGLLKLTILTSGLFNLYLFLFTFVFP